MPGISQHPVFWLTELTQHVKQHKHDSHIAKNKCNFQGKCRFVNRGHGSENQLRSRRIQAPPNRVILTTWFPWVENRLSPDAREKEKKDLSPPVDPARPHKFG